MNEYTQLVYDSRQQVMARMWGRPPSAVPTRSSPARFDTGEIAAQFSEVCCYGTAVAVVPIPEGEPGATPQSIADAKARSSQMR